MGLRGLENGLTRFHEVAVPATSRIGEEGQGLKIALTTLNTGRLSLPASCVAAGKLALKISREWSRERVQWGRPVGEHEAVAKKISFIAATTYAREAVDAHLSAAGELIDSELPPARRARAAARAGGFYARWLPTLVTGQGQRPGAYSEFGRLAAHLRYVERASRKLARVTFYAMARWQGRLERKQGFLGRIVDIGAELFAISAVCVRARSDTGAA